MPLEDTASHRLTAVRQAIARAAGTGPIDPGTQSESDRQREGRCRTHLARLLRIAWLSPRIIEAIVDGAQPRTLNRKMLLAASLPIDWAAQERLLGFAR